jgi:hypothetical protein
VKCIWTALAHPEVMPDVLPIAPLDRTKVVPRQWKTPEGFDASCLDVEFALNRREH